VALRRRPEEEADPGLAAFYACLLQEVGQPPFRQGVWRAFPCRGWPDNPRYRNLLAWGWRENGERRLIVCNYAGEASQGRVRVRWDDVAGRTWRLEDVLTGVTYEREGGEMLDPGLFVMLDPWQAHFFRVS
jgi:hypothetical protein